jgi:hypothetical protein
VDETVGVSNFLHKKRKKKKKKKKKKKLISSPKQDKLRGNDMHVGCD